MTDQRFPALIVTLKKDAYGTPKQKPEQSKSKTELPKDEQSDETLMNKVKELECALASANESKSKAEQQQECLSDEALKMNKKVEELEGALALANEELFRLHTERDDPSVQSKTSTRNFPFFKEAYFGLMSLMKDNNIDVPERYKNPAFSETVQNDPVTL